MIHVNYENSTLIQRMITFGGCVILGGIVLILGICGAFFDYASLVKFGFGFWTVPCYGAVVICGFLILMRMRFAILVAAAAEVLEIITYFTTQMTTSPEVGFLVLLKLAVIVCTAQLCLAAITFEDDPDVPSARSNDTMPQAPRGRVGRSQAPMGRTRQNVSAGQPPRPRR